MHSASLTTGAELGETISQLDSLLSDALDKTKNYNFSSTSAADILKELTGAGKDGEYSDFSSAEQAVMGIAVLVEELRFNNRMDLLPKDIEKKLNDFYMVLENEDSYRPVRLQEKMRNLKKAIK